MTKYSKPSDEKIREMLTEQQYYVTQKEGTERAFTHPYNNNKAAGIYVDIVSGEPLFSSKEKFDSGTGWPSFYDVIDKEYIVEKTDRKLWMTRTEVRSKHGDSHLGHVFSEVLDRQLALLHERAALRFIPVEELEAEGYGEYLSLFE